MRSSTMLIVLFLALVALVQQAIATGEPDLPRFSFMTSDQASLIQKPHKASHAPTLVPTQSPTLKHATKSPSTFKIGSVSLVGPRTFVPGSTFLTNTVSTLSCKLLFNSTGALQLLLNNQVLWSTPSFSNKASLAYTVDGNLTITLNGVVQYRLNGNPHGVGAHTLYLGAPSTNCLTLSFTSGDGNIDWAPTQNGHAVLQSDMPFNTLSAPNVMVNGSCVGFIASGKLQTWNPIMGTTWMSAAQPYAATKASLSPLTGALELFNASNAVVWAAGEPNPSPKSPTQLVLNAQHCAFLLSNVPPPKSKKLEPIIFAGVDVAHAPNKDFSQPKTTVLSIFWGKQFGLLGSDVFVNEVIAQRQALSGSTYLAGLSQYAKFNTITTKVMPATITKSAAPSAAANIKGGENRAGKQYAQIFKHMCQLYQDNITQSALPVAFDVYIDLKPVNLGGETGQCYFTFGTQKCTPVSTYYTTLNLFYNYEGTLCGKNVESVDVTRVFQAVGAIFTVADPGVGNSLTGWNNPLTGETLVNQCVPTLGKYTLSDGKSYSLPTYYRNDQHTCA